MVGTILAICCALYLLWCFASDEQGVYPLILTLCVLILLLVGG